MAQIAKKWTLTEHFHGLPALSNFKLEEEPVSFDLKPGEILLEAVYLTVDPYMRYMREEIEKNGMTMYGQQIARVKVSNNKSYPEGSLVVTLSGWRSLTLVSEPEQMSMFGPIASLLPDFGGLPASLGLGCLGIPGMTAYFGVLDRGKPKAGETVLVNAAAGAVGSLVGQIAKIQGCTVIGSAGSKAKCDWLKELGFDHVFNYKEKSLDEALKEYAPKGIDMYFDNVGGDFTYTVLEKHMKFGGRVMVCGAISQYNDVEERQRSTYAVIIDNNLDMLSVNVTAYKHRFAEGIARMLMWIKKGKIKYRETITDGFENMPQAFIDLFSGNNIGKAVVKV